MSISDWSSDVCASDLLTPNYQVGKDSVAGFKSQFKGEVVDEVYTKLGNLDFSAELAKIAAAKPDVLFTFMPGGMGVNLVKQFKQAVLAKSVKIGRGSCRERVWRDVVK